MERGDENHAKRTIRVQGCGAPPPEYFSPLSDSLVNEAKDVLSFSVIYCIAETAGETFSDLFLILFPFYLFCFHRIRARRKGWVIERSGIGTGGGVMVTVVPCC